MHYGSVLMNINGFSENERIVVLGDMNAKVGNRVVGKNGIPGVNKW